MAEARAASITISGVLTSKEIEVLKPTGLQRDLINELFKTGWANPALTSETLLRYQIWLEILSRTPIKQVRSLGVYRASVLILLSRFLSHAEKECANERPSGCRE